MYLAASTAAWNARLSSVLPSPTAPKSLTETAPGLLGSTWSVDMPREGAAVSAADRDSSPDRPAAIALPAGSPAIMANIDRRVGSNGSDIRNTLVNAPHSISPAGIDVNRLSAVCRNGPTPQQVTRLQKRR